jgi:hypothetical protein
MNEAHSAKATCAVAGPFTLTTSASPLEGGTVTGGGTYECGTTATVEAIPAGECWYFVNWSGDVADPNLASTTVTMDSDKSVTANFSRHSYNLTVTSEGCCQVNVDGAVVTTPYSHDYDCGTQVSLEAVAGEGCDFSDWTVDGNPVPGNPITVTMNEAHSAVATCTVAGPFTLTMAVDGNGSTTPAVGSHSYPCGTLVDITATTADDCWYFVNWSGDLSGSENPTTLHMDSDKSVTANFARHSYSLTVTSVGCCQVNVDGVGVITPYTHDYDCGTQVSLEAVAGECCDFGTWTVDGNPASGNPITVTMNKAHSATATCTVAGPFTLTTSASPPEGGTVTGGGIYDCCTIVEVKAIPAGECWYFTGWSGDLSGSQNPTTIHMDSDKSVTANFAFGSCGVSVVDSWKVWREAYALGEPDGIGTKIRSKGGIIIELSGTITDATKVTVTAAKGRGKWAPNFSVSVSPDGENWTPVGTVTCTAPGYTTSEFPVTGDVKFIKVERVKERGQLYLDAVCAEHIEL